MDEQSNVFLRVLQIGIEREGETICFNDIIKIINNEFKIPMQMVPSVRRWFYDYYYLPETFRMNKGLLNTLKNNDLVKYDEKQAFFSGDGFFKYYEYLEVKTALKNAEIAMANAEKSTELSNKALLWVIVAFVASVVIGATQIFLMVYP